MIERADILKVSDEDLEWLMEEGSMDERARDLLDRGPSLVCLTKGSEGVTGFTRDDEVTVPSERVTVVDTVGAGDTFNAGVLASLHEAGLLKKDALRNLSRDAVRDALTLGAKAAAVTVGRAGANPPTRAELS